MISRRNYFTIIVLIAILCCIFIFTMYAREKGSIYDINMFVVKEDRLPSGKNQWVASGEEELVIYFGGQGSSMENTIKQWCTYTKRSLVQKEHLEDYSAEKDGLPSLILLDAKHLDLGKNGKFLLDLTKLGAPIVFCNLPAVEKIIYSPNLREILGINELLAAQTEIKGIRLFDGFFLGGPAEYLAETEEEEKRQDFELTVPWYSLNGGTKVYMVGIMDKEEVEEGYFPGLLWRNCYKGTMVFAVNGDYINSMAGLGILNSFVYEAYPYTLYPVVNAQNVMVNNFPNFSSENAGVIAEIYSREPEMVYQGIMWPSLSALTKTSDIKLTCLFKPQYVYSDEIEPKGTDVPFYLQQLKGVTSEAGRALTYDEATTFQEMLLQDNKFFDQLNSRYRYQVVYAKSQDIQKVKKETAEDGGLNQLATVCSECSQGDTLLSYLTDDVTLQRITGDAGKHTYWDNFELRGVQTALLYSNVQMDLYDAMWPQEEDDEWQHLYDEMASNIHTYWRNKALDKTTLSESDFRVRIFLNLDYSHQREENKIRLFVENTSEDAWFILRTHDEKMVDITGGEYQQLEKCVYLITAKENVIEISLEPMSLKELEK